MQTANRSLQPDIATMHLALGGNLASTRGAPAATLSEAVAALPQAGLALRAVSRFFATPAYPPGAGPDFVNAAVTVVTELSPQEVLARLHRIEAEFGRRRGGRWSARSLDIDLLAAGAQVMPDAETCRAWMALEPEQQQTQAPDRLILPHPRLQERAFVLVPLADIAPNWRHPLLERTVAEMLAALPQADLAAICSL